MKKAFQVGLTALFVLTATVAGAHSLWFNLDDRHGYAGKPISLELGWGHKFPRDGEIKEGMLKQIVAIDREGKEYPVKQVSKTTFEFVPPAEGVYLISGDIHPGFVSKTTQGYKMGPKNRFEQVVFCFHYNLCTKTFVYAGGPSQTPHQVAGDALEIIPQADPFDLRKGSDFPIQVLFKGKPLAGATLKATYDGFSDQPHTFAQSAQTDSAGVAKVNLTEKGEWFLSVTHETPYPDKAECDTNKYNATMTFRVE